MKKKLAIIVTAVMMLSAVGCTDSSSEGSGSENRQTESQDTEDKQTEDGTSSELNAQSDDTEQKKDSEEELQQFTIDMSNDGKYPQLDEPQAGDKIASINT
ncbi:MAG: hypothetical protein IJ736_16570, partial [Firmicutes bacterium]|nr:hypothetical protein [Bacillota bacterium]